MQKKKKQLTFMNRLILFFVSFCVLLLFQSGMESYQKRSVLSPMEERTESIQVISQFLNELENTLQVLKNHRWDYGDEAALMKALQNSRKASAEYLAQVKPVLGEVSEEQYLLANAVKITYTTFAGSLEEIMLFIEIGDTDRAASTYYSKTEPCGTYLRQYTQQLLEQAILDNQSAYIKFTRMNNKLNSARRLMNGVCLVLGCVVVMSLYVLIHSVRELAQAAKEISAGNLDVSDLDESADDEIGDTAKAFNEMKYSMKRQVQLLSEKTEMEREKMQLLRSQINPHFLFNTLNVVMYTARQEEAYKTRELLESMSQLFRYSLGSNEMEVTLAREVHIVKEFFKLQKIRFGDRVNLAWDVSPEVLLPETVVPSFVLQPVVENAFKHGIVPKENGGVVRISIFSREEKLFIRVEDNGVGMAKENLDDLVKKLENPMITGEHIGLCNVAARLRLREGSGLTLMSGENEGTTVELFMPLVMVDMEDTENDEITHC